MTNTSKLSAALVASWPPILTFTRALAYTGKSRATLNRAVQAGTLALYGRCGGERGERTFRREDLDRWLAGDVERADGPAVTPRPLMPLKSDVRPALDRIARAARGGAR